MSADRIPGTRVPDNALHRASLWLEDFKQTRAGKPEMMSGQAVVEMFEELTRATGMDMAGEEMMEGATYYAQNLAMMLFGERLGISVMTPHGMMDIRAILLSAWIDGFQHGAATATGKRGESSEEIVRRATE